MVTATILVVIFVPLFYVIIEKIFGRKEENEPTGINEIDLPEDA